MYVCSGSVREGSGVEPSDYDADPDDNQYGLYGTNGPSDVLSSPFSSTSSSSSSSSGLSGQRYSEYLFQELCGRLLDTYSEMIRSLTLQQQQQQQSLTQSQPPQQQQLVPSKRTQANPNPNPNPTNSKQHHQNINEALIQALAEYEYFKVIADFLINFLLLFPCY